MSSVATVAISMATMPRQVNAFTRNLAPAVVPDDAPRVFVVDNDIDVQHSLEGLIRSQSWHACICDSAHEFLAQPRSSAPSCLILAFSSADSTCLEVQKQIAREYAGMSIVVLADFGHIPTTVQAMKAGAVDFLVKPFIDEQLVTAIRQSLARSRAALDRGKEMRDLRDCHASLTPREQQVMALVASGLLNKQVGSELGISEITVKAHRGQVMQKMKAASFAHLVNMSLRLRVSINSYARETFVLRSPVTL